MYDGDFYKLRARRPATFVGEVTVGEDTKGKDVKFFGETTGKYMLWDASADELVIKGDVNIDGDIEFNDVTMKDVTITGNTVIGDAGTDTVSLVSLTTVGTNQKIQFRDTGLYLQSSTDGQLDAIADTKLQLTAPTIDLEASSGIALDGDVTIDGAHTLTTGSGNITVKGATTFDADTNLSLSGTGAVITPNIQATNLRANDGTASLSNYNSTGIVSSTSHISVGERIYEKFAVTIETTEGDVTYTAAEMLGGTIARNGGGANRTDTTATAADLVAAMPHAEVGRLVEVIIVNNGSTHNITLNEGVGVNIQGSKVITPKQIQKYAAIILNATGGAESVQLVNLGYAFENSSKIVTGEIAAEDGTTSLSIADSTGDVTFGKDVVFTNTTVGGVETATMSNAVVSGNPTLWLDVYVGSTKYLMPLFPST